MYWLLGPFFIYALAFGGIIVPKLNLVLTLICRKYLAERTSVDPAFTFLPVEILEDNEQCRLPEIQALVSKFMLYISLISGVLGAVACPRLGALSDRFGRKSVLAMTTCGGLLNEAITILAAKYPDAVPYQWILVGAVFDGICGSFIASMALTHSYATDCTAPPLRAVAFGYFHACLFSGVALGPLISGFIVKATGSLVSVFYLAMGCHACFVLFLLFFVPESLSKKRQLAAREKHRLEVEHTATQRDGIFKTLKSANVFAPLKILYPTGPGTNRRIRQNLVLLSMVDCIIFGSAMGAMTVIIYFAEYRFGWGTFETSIFVSVCNISRVSALVVILPLLSFLVRGRAGSRPQPNSGSDQLDLWTIRTSVLFEIIGFAGYALANKGNMFLVSGIFASFGGIGSPTLQSALTKHVPHDRTGELLGATGLLHALARIVCPTVFNLIYAATVGTFPQTVFVVLSAWFGVAFAISWGIRPHGEFPSVPSFLRTHWSFD